jgi:hypothetical protein
MPGWRGQLFACVLSFFIQLHTASANSSSSGSKVVELTELNFDHLVVEKQPWVIDIYAPWQVHNAEI